VLTSCTLIPYFRTKPRVPSLVFCMEAKKGTERGGFVCTDDQRGKSVTGRAEPLHAYTVLFI